MSVPDLSPSAGLGLKPDHFRSALDSQADGLWFEVHPENYMAAGGPRLQWLDAIRRDKPLSLHGVGMSLGGMEPLDPDHLDRWKLLVKRYEPVLVSEHLAWSAHAWHVFQRFAAYADDAARRSIVSVIISTRCKRRLAAASSSKTRHAICRRSTKYPKRNFFREAVRRTGCGLLLDLNNVHVSAHNLGFDAADYLASLPGEAVGEYHLAGHEADTELGGDLLIDTHGADVVEPVWRLYRQALSLIGARPTLIERDNNLPAFDALMTERARAQSMLDQIMTAEPADG